MKVNVVGIQITSPNSNNIIYVNDITTFQFSYYLPGDTQAVYRIINSQTGKAIRAAYVNLSDGSFAYSFSSTASPGVYSATLTGATSGITSVANPSFRVCKDTLNCP